MTVRAPREDDAEALARVHEACWTVSYAGLADPTWVLERPFAERVEEWRGFCRGEGLPMWIAERDGEAVGFVAAGRSRDDDAEDDVGEVVALYVAPEQQGRGVGGALLEHAVGALRADGFARATLWTLQENAAGRRFYEAHGWREDGETRSETRHGEVSVRYSREL